MLELPGFEDPNKDVGDEEVDVKLKKKTKKGGGFESMGLSYNVLKGIKKRGYKIPTPIQRKTIPIALEGRNIVAMARTGSGKTACFLIPLFEKLKIRIATAGARALILSPTRELAVQTLKFIKELGRFSDLKAILISGGDSMDNQFSLMHGNPDIIVATPGRFLHICVEMDLKLNNIEYVVFDEADRLFEMGFGAQMNNLLDKLPDTRQTLLFSATLPKVLVDFARAGLGDPVLIRLDVESKLPSELDLVFLTVRSDERIAALLVLLKLHLDLSQQTVVFAATKYHVDYIHMVLDHVGISNTYIYSSLDATARKIHTAKFTQHKVSVLIVTDVAARGLDIPHLDNVINFNFPDKPKLFVHRVGRCARAGRFGTAYSFVSTDEYPYLIDLHLFLGKSISLSPTDSERNIGCIPQSLIEEQQGTLLMLQASDPDLLKAKEVSEKAYKQYLRTRPVASVDSNRRAKKLSISNAGLHPVFKNHTNALLQERDNFINQMKKYRPQGTVFEVCSKTKSQDYLAMKATRVFHKNAITAFQQKQERQDTDSETKCDIKLPESSNNDIENTFGKIITPKKRKREDSTSNAKKHKVKDEENYIPYSAPDRFTEDGLAINSFQNQADKAELDLVADSTEGIRRAKQQMRWDRKKKKMVGVNSNTKEGKIQTEAGKWIPATYKTYRYEEWKEKTKAAENEDNSEDEQFNQQFNNRHRRGRWNKHNEKAKNKNVKSELRSKDQIVKARKIADRNRLRQNKKLRKKRTHK